MSNLGILEEINYYKQFKTFETKSTNKVNIDDFVIATVETPNKDNKAVILTSGGYEEIRKTEGKKETIVPKLDQRRESIVLYCAGAKGMGKSLFVSDMVRQYHDMYPTNRIFYLCQSPITDDINFKKLTSFVKQIDIRVFTGQSEDRILKALSNSLIVLDDNDNLEDEERRTLRNLQKTVLFLGRKYRISCFKISHYKTDGINTREVITEIDYYVTFVNRDLKKDRLLNEYKNITKDNLNELSSSLWAFFDFKYEYVITNKKIFFLD